MHYWITEPEIRIFRHGRSGKRGPAQGDIERGPQGSAVVLTSKSFAGDACIFEVSDDVFSEYNYSGAQTSVQCLYPLLVIYKFRAQITCIF